MIVNAVVPAKGQSSRLPHKNMQRIGGQSLVYRACETCLNTPSITNTYLNTECTVIMKDCEPLLERGLRIIDRPDYLATNETSGNELIVFEESQMLERPDLILHRYCTAPFLRAETMEEVLVKFGTLPEYDSFFTGIHMQEFVWTPEGEPVNFIKGSLPNAIDLPPFLVETHGLYGIRYKAFERLQRRLGERTAGIRIPRSESLDINDQTDLDLARLIWYTQ